MTKQSVFDGKIASVLCVFCILTAIVGVLAGCDNKTSTTSDVFTIKFVANDGSEVIVWHTGDEIPALSRDGYSFDGWFYDENFERAANLYDLVGSEVGGEISLYAKWTQLPPLDNLIFEDITCIYDGAEHLPTVKNLPKNAKVEYSATGLVDAGTYTVTADVNADGYLPWHGEATLTIEKADVDVSKLKFEDHSCLYDGFPKSIMVNGKLPHGVTITYDGNEQTEVGIYTVTAHFNVGNNYNPVEDMTATLRIKASEHTVTFEHWDGSRETLTVKDGENLYADRFPDTKPRTGYTVNWQDGNLFNIEEDVTVKEVCVPIEYEIYYDFKGGTAEDYSTKYTIEQEVVLVVPTRDYYTFMGWYADESYKGERIDRIEAGNIGRKEFFAKWEATVYHVQYELNGGTNDMSNCNGDGTYSYTVNDNTKELQDPTRAYYKFEGWFEDDRYLGEPIEEIDTKNPRDLTLYAKWVPTEYSINYVLGTSAKNADGNPLSYNIESGTLSLLAAERPGYTFVGWHLNSEGGQLVSELKIDENWNMVELSLYAEWTLVKYHIDYVVEDGENNASNPTEYDVEQESFDLLPATRKGYDFKCWQDEENTQISRLDTSIARDIRLTAVFEEHIYSITYEYEGQHSNPTSYKISDCPLTLAAGVRDGYEFICWETEDGDEVSVITENMLGNLVLRARERMIVPEFTIENGVLIGYDHQKGGIITVPAEFDGQRITGIAAGVFDDSVTELVIEAELTQLTEGVFDECVNLEKLVLPTSLETLAKGTLKNLGKLKELRLPFAGNRPYDASDGGIGFETFGYLFSGSNQTDSCYEVIYYRYTNDGIPANSGTAYIPDSLKTVIIDGDVMPYAFNGYSELDTQIYKIERFEIYGNFVGAWAISSLVEEVVFYNAEVEVDRLALYNDVMLKRIFIYGNLQDVPAWVQPCVNVAGISSVEVHLMQEGGDDIVKVVYRVDESNIAMAFIVEDRKKQTSKNGR